MKRMNEVFELPLATGERSILDADDIFQADGNGVWCATFCSHGQAKAACNAINHVDALADALADLIISCRANGSNILACTYAEEALAAYRGEK